jgi:hypothetical protein
MVGLRLFQKIDQPPTDCSVDLTSWMALYDEHPYHYMMLATTFHPLGYL